MENNNNQGSFFTGVNFLNIQKKITNKKNEIKELEDVIKKEQDEFLINLIDHVTNELSDKTRENVLIGILFEDSAAIKQLKDNIALLAQLNPPNPRNGSHSIPFSVNVSNLLAAGFGTEQQVLKAVEEINATMEGFICFEHIGSSLTQFSFYLKFGVYYPKLTK